MRNLITKTINLHEGNPDDKRIEILEYFKKTWEIDEKLYELIREDETFYLRADPLRHPLIFYLGHTATFFINKLFQAELIDKRIEPAYESVFAVGVDEMSWDDIDETHYNWPGVSQVRAYRDKAKKVIIKVIEETPLQMPITWESPFWAIMMGIEHERIHLETSSVLIRQLPLDRLQPGKFGEICPYVDGITRNEFLAVPGAVVVMGKPFNHPLYGWDCEYGAYEEPVASFMATKELIPNREFLKFVEAGGYQTKKYWTDEGWRWKCFKQAEMPLFWRKDGGKYFLRLVDDELSMPWIWPVEVNYLEAKAYCNWKSEQTERTLRMMTETEWYRLVEFCKVPDSQVWGLAPGNINLEHYASPCPVNMFKMGEFNDVIGNVWQWTETQINEYPGFKVHPLYDDFSMPTFDGQHNLIKGGSWISTGNEITLHARYAFRRHFYQHAGFRVVESV